MTDQPFQPLGKYEVLEEIGRGGFGVVYKARDTKLNRVVALKILMPQLTADPGFVHQFHREAQLVARLDHPHIVTVYDVGEEQGQHYIAMQYIEGPSLDRRLTRGQPWLLEQILPLAEQIAGALDYAHAQGVLHLDLKPGNILLNDHSHAWLTDFGLGRAVSSASQPASAMSGGTAAYLAPEQADLEEPRPITPLADIYAFGVLLYQLCTGRAPFEGNPIAVANAHVNQQPPRPTLLNDQLSQAVEEVLLRALAKSPQARFPDAAGLFQALAEAVKTGLARPTVARVIAVEPFVLGDFRVRTLREMAQACDGAWEEAVERLYDGSLEQWLTEARVLGAAAEAKRIRKARVKAQGREREVGLEEFLAWTGYVTDPVLSVKPDTLDFGAEEKGYDYRLLAVLTVQNAGRGLLWGEVVSLVPWIDVPKPHAWVRPGERQEVLVEARMDALPSGRTIVDDALAVRTQVNEMQIGARVEVWGPEVRLDPTELDFGEVGEDEEPVRSLTVANMGRGALMGTARTETPGLTVTPERFRCAAGRQLTLQVRLDRKHLPTLLEAIVSITLETNEGNFEAPVRLMDFGAIGIDVLEPELVHVPAGPFTMGSDDIDDANPVHTIDLPEYWIGKHPVTNQEYACFVRATGHPAPYMSESWAEQYNWRDNSPPKGKEKHPVVLVSWHDAVAYCRWLSEMTGKPYRLPTEAEWEKVARGTDGREYPWGNQWDAQRANTSEGDADSTTPAGQYPQGASPYGALDMAGNVWEWCSSLYQPYPYQPDDGREDPSTSDSRVLRGGSWNYDRDGTHCAFRDWYNPAYRGSIGFRCCASARSSLR